MFYIPLYFAGPIVTFNSFISQVRVPKTIERRGVAFYGLRLIVAILLMEAMMHAFHVVAIKDANAWAGMSPLQLICVGFLNLKFIWLKVFV